MSQQLRKVCCLLVLYISASTVFAEHEVVLVTSTKSCLKNLSSLDIRKAFFGVPITRCGQRVRAVHSNYDTLLKKIFLQNVVSMSEDTYQRRLLHFALQAGRRLPDRVSNLNELEEILGKNANTIAVIWKKDAQDRSDKIRVVKVLWKHD
jgi:hypothetical protein